VEASLKNQLRLLREHQGLSQQQLGEILGVSRQTINAIENERYDPSLPLAFKISRQFKLRIEDIFVVNEH
jgi:putative transcriptional regulator